MIAVFTGEESEWGSGGSWLHHHGVFTPLLECGKMLMISN
jgi:hypothetical protein